MTQMQGIVSILRSDNLENTTKAASLRRTLSADMSSKRWLTDNGVLSMKKNAVDFSSSPSSSESDEEECETARKRYENPKQIDIWTAIMSQKKQDDSGKLPPPYVHPLVKKSARSLSETSLKICTESLGSETGSDIVLNPSSNIIDDQQKEKEKNIVVKHACLTTRKSNTTRSFPPPLPSLATDIDGPSLHMRSMARSVPPPLTSIAVAGVDGPSLHMHSRRIDGRLVLEAVSIPPQNYFEAQRQDGRFLLTLINHPKEQEQPSPQHHLDEQKPQHGNDIGKKEHEDEIKTYPNNKDIGILNERPITQSLPPKTTGLPPLPLPSPTFVNSYEYLWRAKPTVASVIDPLMSQLRPPTKTKDMVLVRGNKADCLLPSLKGCKEPRRSHLMWEPFCIATS